MQGWVLTDLAGDCTFDCVKPASLNSTDRLNDLSSSPHQGRLCNCDAPLNKVIHCVVPAIAAAPCQAHVQWVHAKAPVEDQVCCV